MSTPERFRHGGVMNRSSRTAARGTRVNANSLLLGSVLKDQHGGPGLRFRKPMKPHGFVPVNTSFGRNNNHVHRIMKTHDTVSCLMLQALAVGLESR
jgi:hypothetical protein